MAWLREFATLNSTVAWILQHEPKTGNLISRRDSERAKSTFEESPGLGSPSRGALLYPERAWVVVGVCIRPVR